MNIVKSTFRGTVFEPYEFIKQICSENPYQVCIIYWIECASEDIDVNKAEFFDANNHDLILQKLDEFLEYFTQPIFENNKLISEEWNGDRADNVYEFLNLTPSLQEKIMHKISQHKHNEDHDDSDDDTSKYTTYDLTEISPEEGLPTTWTPYDSVHPINELSNLSRVESRVQPRIPKHSRNAIVPSQPFYESSNKDNLEALSVVELRKRAKDRGFKGYSKLRKVELLQLLMQ